MTQERGVHERKVNSVGRADESIPGHAVTLHREHGRLIRIVSEVAVDDQEAAR